MQWSDIRRHYPDQRLQEQLAIIAAFSDSQSALAGYTQLHREAALS